MKNIFLVFTILLFGLTFSFADEYILDKDTHKEFVCMAQNLHHEARGEPTSGITAVANVVINRTNSPLFPDSVCGVVHQKHQFSWVGRVKPKPITHIHPRIKFIAYETVVNNSVKDITNGALFFKTRTTKSNWNLRVLKKTRTIGNHDFYKIRKVL